MFVVINNVWRPEVDYSSLQINQSASDPMPTCDFTLVDTGSAISISEMQEVRVLDGDAFPNQGMNFMLGPQMSPYTDNWNTNPFTGVTYSQNGGSGGIILTLSNVATGVHLGLVQQTTLIGLTVPGQTYTTGVTITGASLVAAQANVRILFLDANKNGLTGATSANVTPTGTPQRIFVSATAPAGAAFIQMNMGINITNATNSGTITFFAGQVEPNLFAAAGVQYPTPIMTQYQPLCTLLPNGLTVREQRVFTGFITNLLFDSFTGSNRLIHVKCSGPAFLLQSIVAVNPVTNLSCGQILINTVATYLAGIISTNHVQPGPTVDSYSFFNANLHEVTNSLASLAEHRWYVDPYYDIWFQPPGYYTMPFGLSDSPDNVLTFPFANYSREVDFTQACNVCLVNIGSTATQIFVRDAQSASVYKVVGATFTEFTRRVSDSSITTQAAAVQRGIAETTEYAFGRTIVRLEVDQRAAQPILPGNTIALTNSVDGITLPTAYIVQVATITCLGVDRNQLTRWLYKLELGAFQSALTNILARVAAQATESNRTQVFVSQQYNATVVEVLGSTETYIHTP